MFCKCEASILQTTLVSGLSEQLVV